MESPDNSARQIGLRIARLREEQALSQKELSIRADLPYQTLSEIENGKRMPSVPSLHRIAGALGVTLAAIQPEDLDHYGEPSPSLYLLAEKLKRLPKEQQKMLIRMFMVQADSLIQI